MRLNPFITPSTCVVIVSLAMNCLGNGPEGDALQFPERGLKFSSQESHRLFPEMPKAMRMRREKRSFKELKMLDAHRALTGPGREYILSLCDYLVDKRFGSSRWMAAQTLGDCGHSIAIPALLAVIRDEEDNMEVRTRAIKALGRINDKRVVMYLIEDGFGSGERRIMRHAWEALAWCLSDVPDNLKNISYLGGFLPPQGLMKRGKDAPPIDPKKLDAYLDIWREWWKKNHENVTVTRPIGIP